MAITDTNYSLAQEDLHMVNSGFMEWGIEKFGPMFMFNARRPGIGPAPLGAARSGQDVSRGILGKIYEGYLAERGLTLDQVKEHGIKRAIKKAEKEGTLVTKSQVNTATPDVVTDQPIEDAGGDKSGAAATAIAGMFSELGIKKPDISLNAPTGGSDLSQAEFTYQSPLSVLETIRTVSNIIVGSTKSYNNLLDVVREGDVAIGEKQDITLGLIKEETEIE